MACARALAAPRSSAPAPPPPRASSSSTASCSSSRLVARAAGARGRRDDDDAVVVDVHGATRRRRRAVVPRASSSSSSSSSPAAPSEAHAEPYSFFDLATAEFPADWRTPTAKVTYADSPLDLALMAWFMRKIAMAIDAPFSPADVSYDAFIALCFLQMRGRDPDGQRDITLGIMRSLMPPGGDKVFRKLFPTNKFSLELNATICKVVFAWMVGPMTVEKTDENDLREEMASRVHIKKCRWLQESGCTGMCVNMCKARSSHTGPHTTAFAW
jgi:hypothetical protein